MRPSSADHEFITLLPVFEAVFKARSVSRAAGHLGVTQSAVSHALARLRVLVDDQLFVSTGRGVRPTPKAEAIAQSMHALLKAAGEVLRPSAVDPHKLSRTFYLDIRAGFDALIVPPLIAELERVAPEVRISVSSVPTVDAFKDLQFGRTDLLFDFRHVPPGGFKGAPLAADAAVLIARKDHPALHQPLTRETYQQLAHAGLTWYFDGAASGVQIEHERQQLQIAPKVQVPTIHALALVVEQTDLVATVSGIVGLILARRHAIGVRKLPFRFGSLSLHAIWHERCDGDREHQWFRETLLTALTSKATALR